MGSGWNIGHNLCSNEVFALHRAKKKKGGKNGKKAGEGERGGPHIFCFYGRDHILTIGSSRKNIMSVED